MLSLAVFNRRFTPSWRMSVLVVFSILLFSRLGFWQLQRADEKKQMLTAHRVFAKQAPLMWQSGNKQPGQYQPIHVKGHFLPQVFLLDNQHHHHQFGYHVISPLVLTNGQVILVDRGWLAGDVTRQILPVIDTPTHDINLIGDVYYPSAKNWILGDVFEKKQASLAVVELIDTPLISQFLHKSVYPFIIRLGKQEANGYVREWAIVAMPPQRHYAYALQWFAMALVIFILFVALNIHEIIPRKKT